MSDEKVDPSWEAAWDAEPAAPVEELAAPPEDHPADPDPEQPEGHPQVEEPNPMVDALQRMADSQKQYADSVQQSVGGLAEQLRQVNAEAAVARQTPGGPSQEQIDQAQKDPASWAKLKEDWSEWATPIEELFDVRIKAALAAAGKVDEDAIAERISKRFEAQRLAEKEAEKAAEVRAQREVAERFQSERAKVLKVYPNFDVLRTDPTFKEWASKQDAETQALAASTDAIDAIKMMNQYVSRPSPKTATSVQAQRDQRLRQSAVPSRTVTPGPKQPIDTSNMTWDQAWEYDTQIKAQQARA